ncbi:molybdate ABC transporter permease subunit [Alkalibacter saccharofermentans]|uniref:Molybdenum transport system permease n=1 Tax=Alkalibacter saccharofermentans DSM 14828 TaxID=1120975 RepID=A0A1M4SAM7_9FIRM|nr:molybdate ABC transporter permease subunit [Alkalibacter saccharofermentans]SHE29284.1 molybdate transport system permease protein [Alkalibacter saccharofermentans DSM 14828]
MDYAPLFISLKTAMTATVITFIFGIFAAWFMCRYDGKLKSLIDSVFLLPMVLPPTVVGFILLIAIGRNSPVGKFLSLFDLNLIFTWPALVLAASVVAFPLMYKTSKAAFEQIDRDILDVARTLGAGEFKIFIKLMIPNALPGILAGAVLSFARALGEFGATLMVGGSIPGRTLTVPVAIFFASESGNTKEALIWVAVIFSISLFIMTLINNNEGKSMGNYDKRKELAEDEP